MNNKPKHRLIVTIILFCFFALTGNVKCQEINFIFSIDSVMLDEGKYIKNISVEITKGHSPYTIMLFKDDRKSQPIKIIENTQKRSLTFKDVQQGLYIIHIQDKRNLLRGKSCYIQ